LYLWNPKLNIYYVAAKGNNASWLVDKDNGLWWCNYGGTNLAFKGKDVINKRRKPNDRENIKIALNDGCYFSTRNYKIFKPVRKGTAHIIKEHRL
jgi:hypothetical protein